MRSPWHNPRGSITLVALSLAIVIGISLASYLALCQQSLLLSTRTIQLSKARLLAETGLEEALWSLNVAANPDSTVSVIAWTNASWSPTPTSADRSCTIAGYDLGDGTIGKIDITIAYFDGPKAAVTPSPQVPAPTIVVTATVTLPGMGDFKRTLNATTKPAPLFANAIGIIDGYNGRIRFNSFGTVDSWDSDYDSTATPNWDYNATTPAIFYSSVTPLPPVSTNPKNYAAVVAAPRITLNSATIYGYAATFGSTLGTPANYTIKGPPPSGPPPSGAYIDPARVSKSAFVPNFPVAKPTGAGTTPNLDPAYTATNPTITGGTILNPEIKYATSDLILSGKFITVQGPTIIIVPGDLILTNGAKIIVDDPAFHPNARLEIFVTGNIQIGDVSSPDAGFDNKTKQPKNLALYSTGPSRTFVYNSNLDYCGVMYSAAGTGGPSSTVTVQFNSSPQIYGAILANDNIDFASGTSPQIHYDTALQYLPKGWFKGVTTPFMITQVTETP